MVNGSYTLDYRKGRSLINSCLCFRPCIRTSVSNFSGSLFISFSEIFHINKNLETKKVIVVDFSEKNLFALKRIQMGKKWSLLSFHKILSLLFAGINLIWKTLKYYVLLCNAISRKILVQNTFIQSDCKIL